MDMTNQRAIGIIENHIIFHKIDDRKTGAGLLYLALQMAIEALALQDRIIKQGYWVKIEDTSLHNAYKCSECGHQIYCPKEGLSRFKGCYCGAKMSMVRTELMNG